MYPQGQAVLKNISVLHSVYGKRIGGEWTDRVYVAKILLNLSFLKKISVFLACVLFVPFYYLVCLV